VCVWTLGNGGSRYADKIAKKTRFGVSVEGGSEIRRVNCCEMRQDGRVDNSPGMEGNLGLANGGANKNCTAGFCVEHCQQTERVPST
jgi:hypothetical protein